MNHKLKQLFDYQKFEGNEHLDKLIRDADNYSYQELSDDELMGVAAAGDMSIANRGSEKENEYK